MFLLLGIFFLALVKLTGQGLFCETSERFCTGSINTFPAGIAGNAQFGAYYGCLETQPAPAWFHMQIDNPGPITLYMFSTPLVDIDFICWGPFTDQYEPCMQGLTAGKVVDCSYSPYPTEYCVIPNSQTGQYYILMITNFSQQVCEITFSQTDGSGSTDCTILPPLLGNNGPLCVGDNLQLTAEIVPDVSYWWNGPAGFLSSEQNPFIPNTTIANAGDYSCVITLNGQSSEPAISTVIIYTLPMAEAGIDIVIPYGTNTMLQGTATNGSGSYDYHWEPAGMLENPDIATPQTMNLYTSTIFALYVTDLTNGCKAKAPDQMTVIISGDALSASPHVQPKEICIGESAQLFAVPGGGAGPGTYTYIWYSDYGFSSTEQNPWVTPQAAGFFLYNCIVSDGFNSVQGSVGLNVRDVPFVNFGSGDTIVCVYDTLVLDAGNPESYYIWSNGSTDRTISVARTGFGSDIQTYSVTVTNPLTGCYSEDTIRIVFDLSACNGIEGDETWHLCRIYPNPGDGTLHLVFQSGVKEALISASNILGETIWGPYQFKDLEVNGDIVINLGINPKGVYFIHFKYDDSVLSTSKYILRR